MYAKGFNLVLLPWFLIKLRFAFESRFIKA